MADIKKLLESFDRIGEAKTKDNVPAPRNVVAKNAKTSGAGQHKNPREIENTRKEKHKKDFLKDLHEAEKDTRTLRRIEEAYNKFKEDVDFEFDAKLASILKARGYKGPIKLEQMGRKWIKALGHIVDIDDGIMVKGRDPEYDGWVAYVYKMGQYAYGAEQGYQTGNAQSVEKNTRDQGVAEGEKKPHPKTWHDVDPKLGKQVDKMSQAEKVKKGLAHPDTLNTEKVYKVVALDKSNALKKPTKLNVKASSIEDVFSRLAANDWYALSINGVEVVAGKRLKQGVAEDFSDDLDDIYAVHPGQEESESVAIKIVDVDLDEFDDRWSALPMPYLNEFGGDLPLWDMEDLKMYPYIKVQRMTFDQYVKLVSNYINSDDMVNSVLNKIQRGMAEGSLNEGIMDQVKRIYMMLVNDLPMGTPESEFLGHWQRIIYDDLGKKIDIDTLARLRDNFVNRYKTMGRRSDAVDWHREMGQDLSEGLGDINDIAQELDDMLNQGTDYVKAVKLIAKKYNTHPEYVVRAYEEWGDFEHDDTFDIKEQGVAEGFARFQVGDKISFPLSQMATGIVDKIDDKRLYVKLDNGEVYTIPSTMLHSVKLLERQGVAESLRTGEYYLYKIYFDDGTTSDIEVTSDEFDFKSYYAKKGKNVVKVERQGGIRSDYAEGMTEESDKCPPATQDIKLNLENRQKAIDEYGYGPLNPALPNTKFWMQKVKEWKLDSAEEAKQSLCGNCAAFDIRQKTLDCIAQGIDSEDPYDASGVIEAGELGYCKFLKFKCASKRTCDAWVTGGPLTDNKDVNESDISGLLAASKLNKSFIITANLAEGGRKKFRVKAQSERTALEKFKKHHAMAKIVDIKQEEVKEATTSMPTSPTAPTSATSAGITSATQQKPLNLQAVQQQLKIPGNPMPGSTTGNAENLAAQAVIQKALAGKPLDSAENNLYHSLLQKAIK